MFGQTDREREREREEAMTEADQIQPQLGNSTRLPSYFIKLAW